MIVFRPFKGEILLGKISSGTEHGIKSTCLMSCPCDRHEYPNYSTVSVEFFNDILIPPPMLMDGAKLYVSFPSTLDDSSIADHEHSDYADQVWTWDNDGTLFYLDVGEIVRFRVETEEWHDQIPNAPDLGEEMVTERKPAYSIFVSLPSDEIMCVAADLVVSSGLDADPRSRTNHLVVICYL